MEYRREIDGLRALAVVPVILFHAGFSAVGGGFVGVDVFFVISGFLITSILLNEMQQRQFSLVTFYERRARRILPALFLVIFACIPFAWVLMLPNEMKDFSRSLAAVAIFASNILFFRESGYFDVATELKPLLHTWSLAVEEQYYLIFPLFLMLLWKAGKRWLWVSLTVVCLLSFGIAQWASVAKPSAAFYLLPTRGWELLVGALAATYLSSGRPLCVPHAVKEFGAWLGVGLIAYAVLVFSKTTPFPGVYALAPTLGALLIILLATKDTLAGRCIGSRFFVSIGLLSYSAYLWHQPVFAFARHAGVVHNRLAYVFLIAIVFGLAYVSWRFVERPFRDKQRFGRKKIFLGCFVFGAVVLGFGYVGNKTDGFAGRDGMVLYQDLSYDFSKLGYKTCDNELSLKSPQLNFCYQSGDAPNALLLGDSHADDKFYGLEKSMAAFDWQLIGNSSCPPLLGVSMSMADGTQCTARLEKLFAHIAKQRAPALVVLSFAHVYPLDTLVAADHIQRGFDPKDSLIRDSVNPSLGKADAFYEGLRRTLSFLSKRQIKTLLVLDVPELTNFPADCLRGRASCLFQRAPVLERQALMRARVKALQSEYSNLLVFDPLGVFCSGEECSMLKDGRSLYRDSHHLSLFGSLQYGKALTEWYEANSRH